MKFVDSALHIDPANLLPILEVGPSPGTTNNVPLGFDRWWNRTVVVRDMRRATWTRQQLVLDLANKEGGAHYDPMRPEDLKALEDDNSMGWTYSDPIVGSDQPMVNGPLLPSVRQIAFELQSSLQKHFGTELE
jgi:hypothetical protein